MTPSSHLSRNTAGVSLVEILVAVAVVGVIAAIGFSTYSNVRELAQEKKLQSDVTTINRAIQVYQANGGMIPAGTDAAAVIAKLKTTASATQEDQVVGMRGSMVDSRLTMVAQTAAEQSTSDVRAVWNLAEARFDIVTTGAGVKKFVLTDVATGATSETREMMLEFASTDDWVWDFEDVDAGRPDAPEEQPTTPTEMSAVPSTPGSAITLQTPTFTVTPGYYPLVTFPDFGEINDPNTGGNGQLMYATSAGAWVPYTGAVELVPGTTLDAYVRTTNPDIYSDSLSASASYTSTPAQLEIAVNFDETSYDYVELGGALMPGSYAAPVLADEGTVTLTNGPAIPTQFQNSGVFDARWTFDGADPLSSGSATVGAAFTGGFPGQDIPLALGAWGSSDSIEVKVAAKSHDTNIVTDSEVDERTLTVDPIPLREPTLTVSNETEVTFAFDTSQGDMPAGARIFYTTDGTDPGMTATNEPVSGALYSGMFNITPGQVVTARIYPPAEYQQWFTVSDDVALDYVDLNLEVYVGGEFFLAGSSGATHRNIARLAPDGSIDVLFDPGLGTEPGSSVGVVQRASGGVVVGGDFSQMNGISRPALVRLQTSGGIDTGFNAGLQ